jgi:hypothetical protein
MKNATTIKDQKIIESDFSVINVNLQRILKEVKICVPLIKRWLSIIHKL